ncbi:MAG: hypothetical protein HKN31_06670 [Pricia sp.]|nr:hypothetical protein [Pricia sp.]
MIKKYSNKVRYKEISILIHKMFPFSNTSTVKLSRAEKTKECLGGEPSGTRSRSHGILQLLLDGRNHINIIIEIPNPLKAIQELTRALSAGIFKE